MTEPGDLAGRTIAITGASSGIGRAAAVELAQQGARVVLLVRDTARGETVREQIKQLSGEDARVRVVQCDLSSFASVGTAATEVLAACPELDVLVNNAGLIASARQLTADGHELTFQVNHLSHHLLTRLLRPALQAAQGRVVTVSSDAHYAAWRGLRFDDLTLERRWSPFGAYAHSKLANIMFAYELAVRLGGTGVTSNVMHPGMASTGFGQDGWGASGQLWGRFVPKLTAQEAADTLVYLCAATDVGTTTGAYFYRRRPKGSSPVSRDKRAWTRLWELSEHATWTGGEE
ncbi:MAG: SDR family oxidoreductase [Coriobacteriia bacterium]|nr:SDR family oxidoreductase [Coriobacteriia bacterium]